jgi:hypothetical protein
MGRRMEVSVGKLARMIVSAEEPVVRGSTSYALRMLG